MMLGLHVTHFLGRDGMRGQSGLSYRKAKSRFVGSLFLFLLFYERCYLAFLHTASKAVELTPFWHRLIFGDRWLG
jgi:hypothetical protein